MTELETLRTIGESGHTHVRLFDGTIFERLLQLDLVTYISIAPGIIGLTGRGMEVLAEIDRNGWVLGPWEARELVATMKGKFEVRLAALVPFIGEPARFEVIVRQLQAAGLPVNIVAWSVHLVMRENRSAVAFSLATHADPAIRAELFDAWGGPGEGVDEQARFLPPGAPFEWSTDPMFVDLLHLGLDDDSADVRDAAARLAYITQAGIHAANELLAELANPHPSTWAAAALGTARDERSLAALRGLVASADEQLAAAAIRGLAARPDGRDEFLAALHDSRQHVRWVAEMSLGMIARDLANDVLVRLDREAELRTALAHYRARHRS